MTLTRIGTTLVLCAAGLLAACAAKAPATPETNSYSASDVAATMVVQNKAKVPSGYRAVVKNGVEYYCTKEPVTGSRTETFERCLTEAQMIALREGGQDFLRRQQSRPGDQMQPSNGRMGSNPMSGN